MKFRPLAARLSAVCPECESGSVSCLAGNLNGGPIHFFESSRRLCRLWISLSSLRSLGVRLFTNPPIGKALAADLGQGSIATLNVAKVECDTVIVAEVKFRQIAVKVLLGAMLIDALHAAFEDAEIAFNRVGMNRATNVLLG